MTGFVYAIGAGEVVKIGWSANPMRRFLNIQTGCPAGAKLLGFIQATKAQEKEIHELLSPWRLHGEWFRNSKIVEAFVAMLPICVPALMSSGRKRGRPKITAQRPWEAAGVSRAAWYRQQGHQAEQRGKK